MQGMNAQRADTPALDVTQMLRRGLHLHRQNRFAEAEQLYLDALEQDPNSFQGFHLLAVLRMQQGALADALELVATGIERSASPEKALALCVPTLTKLAAEFRAESRHDEALSCYDLILAVPGEGDIIHDRCVALLSLGRFEEALADAERCIGKSPDNVMAHFSRGNALRELNRWEDAVAAYERVLALDPDVANAHRNLAGALRVLGRLDDAISHFDRALALGANDIETRAGKGLLLLSTGKFAEGWAQYDGRLDDRTPGTTRNYPQRRWAGEAVDGTLLVWGEQGLGDQILYASMIPDLAGRATHVVAEVAPRLADLFARSFPGIKVVPVEQGLHRGPVAAHAPIGSIGQYLRRSFEDFPRRDGFLVADAERTAALRTRLAAGGRRVIGISWNSRNPAFEKAKSAALADFASIFRLPNCRFVDLQYGDTAGERARLQKDMGVTLEHLDDIDTTQDIDGLAALISACDAVATVSNTTAHLAGALGRPVWTFVPFGPARMWYWFDGRSDSPFYGRMQVRPQGRGQSWADLIAAAAPEIESALA